LWHSPRDFNSLEVSQVYGLNIPLLHDLESYDGLYLVGSGDGTNVIASSSGSNRVTIMDTQTGDVMQVNNPNLLVPAIGGTDLCRIYFSY